MHQTSSKMLDCPSLRLSAGSTNASVLGKEAINRIVLLFTSPSPSMLATKLNMSPDSAERWIVNLIRNAKLDAKIDAKEVWGGLLMRG